MQRREFAKDILLSSLALAAAPLVRAGDPDDDASRFLKIILSGDSPQFEYFSIDSLGKNKLEQNIILPDAEWSKHKHTVSRTTNEVHYKSNNVDTRRQPAWRIRTSQRSFT
ncbi:MAG: hypothetical protein EOO01_21310, partial [Chitinophagaceae bacterium]